MSPKRGDRVPAPPIAEEWEFRFVDNAAARGWEQLCRHVPTNPRWAYDLMRLKPRPIAVSRRHHPLRYEHRYGSRHGQDMERWQIEVTGGGRVWYLVDDDKHTVWVEYAGTGHPRATD